MGWAALDNPSGWVIFMPTVHRAGNLRFVVFLNDHDPPHVHVFSRNGEAKLLLGPEGGHPTLAWARGFTRSELRRMMRETLVRRAKLLAAWCRVCDTDEQGTANA